MFISHRYIRFVFSMVKYRPFSVLAHENGITGFPFLCIYYSYRYATIRTVQPVFHFVLHHEVTKHPIAAINHTQSPLPLPLPLPFLPPNRNFHPR